MCTLTYLPLGKGWLLTSNRDESPLRPTLPPSKHQLSPGTNLVYPQDSVAGGTWIAMAENGNAACLLNGAFVRHERKLPYRLSRGVVFLDFFKQVSVHSFYENYPLDNIEPFTLIAIQNGKIYELRWDGIDRHLKTIDETQPHLWASSTLYTQEYIEKRNHWFQDWLNAHPAYSQQQIVDFHQQGGEGDKYNDMLMNRMNVVRTISITSIESKGGNYSMYYLDLLTQKSVLVDFNHF
ncbi:MAG: NRDE family protein [Chitinophagales bacterium]|nr:NRDE family protein [Chitinophagales bacterium]